MNNQIISKVLMFVLGAFILVTSGLLFVLQPEMALGYKVLAIGCGIAVIGIIVGIHSLITVILNLFTKFDEETKAIREGLGICREAVEILEAVNVVEIKKNKTVKDIYDFMSANGNIAIEKAEIPTAPVKVEINTAKLEELLNEIKIAVTSHSVVSTPVLNKAYEKEEKESVEVEDKRAEYNVESEAETTANLEEQELETTAETFNKEEEITEKVEQLFEIEKESVIETDIEKEITEKEDKFETVEETTQTKVSESVEERVLKESNSAIMSSVDYFNEPTKEEEIKKEEIVVETIKPVIEERKTEAIKENMVYGLVAEEENNKKSNKKVIHFADVVIEDIIRDMLEKPSEEILDTDLNDIDVVLAGNQGVKRLEGIENLVNLQKLDLWKAEISNIEILKSLKKLVYLRLSKTMVTDLTPLIELENLEELYLQEVPVESLKPLSSLQKLKYLYLEKTKIDSLEPLLDVATLEELYLWGAVVDLAPGGINSEVLKKLESRGCSIIK